MALRAGSPRKIAGSNNRNNSALTHEERDGGIMKSYNVGLLKICVLLSAAFHIYLQARVDLGYSIDDSHIASYKSCLQLNSESWLNSSTRISNVPLESNWSFYNPLLDGSALTDIIDQQGICYPKSPFRTIVDSSRSNEDEIYIWKMRLLYASIFHHQHHHAFAEARLRAIAQAWDFNQYQKDIQQHNISSFDYECTSAKFFVCALPSFGLGANIRQTAVNAILIGLAMNRTVLLINNVKKIEAYGPWILGKCDREDFQCFFRPVSPCVITVEQLNNAPVISTEIREVNKLIRQIDKGEPYPHQEDKVVRMDRVNSGFLPVTDSILHYLHSISNQLIDQLKAQNAMQTSIDVLRKAADAILDESNLPDENIGLYERGNSNTRHAIIMYILRPLQEKNAKLQEFVQNDVPSDIGSSGISLGLPIRGSDKCNRESECLSFPSYMNMMSKVYKNTKTMGVEGNERNSLEIKPTVNIFLTSEQERIMTDKESYLRNSSLLDGLPFIPSFITNKNDIHQGVGNMGRSRKRGFDPDDVMLSTMSALLFQLYSQHTVGNCCSHFHSMIFDFLRGGCGVSLENRGECMQSMGDPHFNLCCELRSNPRCIRMRDEELQSIYGDPNVTLASLQLQSW